MQDNGMNDPKWDRAEREYLERRSESDEEEEDEEDFCPVCANPKSYEDDLCEVCSEEEE